GALPGHSSGGPRSSDRGSPLAGSATLSGEMRRLPILALLFAATTAGQPDGAIITLGVGQQKVIQLANVARVAIGEPEIADVKQVGGGGELLITGVGEGRTSLLVWRANEPRLSYLVVVRRQDPRDLMT